MGNQISNFLNKSKPPERPKKRRIVEKEEMPSSKKAKMEIPAEHKISWKRDGDLESFKDSFHKIVFQQIDIDHYVKNYPEPEGVLRLYGVTMDGIS